MTEKNEVYDAMRTCFIGDDGELHPEALRFINWLRDTCHYGDTPLDEAHYNGDLVMLGRVIGRQEVFGKFIEAMSIPPETVRQDHIESVRRDADMGEFPLDEIGD